MAQSLKNLLDSGVPEDKVLPCMTSNVATLLRLRQKGRIAQGLDADLVVLDRHNQVDSVMARGAWHVKNSAQLLTGLFEA
jgi:beta-aspartyl-dipeptidase (metallo-type)